MVKLEEVEDEEFVNTHPGEKDFFDDDDDDFTDTGTCSPLTHSIVYLLLLLFRAITLYPLSPVPNPTPTQTQALHLRPANPPASESEVSTDSDAPTAPPSESLTDRLYALQDMVSPSTRRKLSSGFNTTKSYLTSGAWFGGKAVWIITTSMLLWGVPFGIALVEEQQALEMEKEQKMRELGNEVLAGGGGGNAGSGGLAAGQGRVGASL